MREKDFDKKNRGKKTGGSNTATGMGQVSTAHLNKQPQEITNRQDTSSHRQESSQQSNKRNVRNVQLQMEIKMEQEKIEEEERNFLNNMMKKAKELPSEQEQKLMGN